jgi:DNA polymerase III subunit delta'
VFGFDSIRDQHRPIRLLKALLRTETIPHALLFTGIDGIGKRTAAMAFAMACNCSEKISGAATSGAAARPCGRCPSCRKISAGSHPDVIPIVPSGAMIRIDEIRELCHVLGMKPYEARFRVVIISDAQAMNPEAGNALLKMLEEPPDRTLLILTAPGASDLLPTIASRCQLIRFQPISRQTLEKMLIEDQGLPPDEAAALAVMAHGSYAKAVEMHRNGSVDRRQWLIRQIEALPSTEIGSRLAFAAALAGDRDHLGETLEFMCDWLRDLAVWRFAPERITNTDLRELVETAVRKSSLDGIQRKIEAIENARRHIAANGNLRLTLEVMTLRLAGD